MTVQPEMNQSSGAVARSPRRVNPLIVFGVIVAVIAIILGLGYALVEAGQTQLTSGPAPDFSLKTYNGNAFRLSDYRGKVVLINFWASWCVPCRDEAPVLNTLWNEYKDRGVVIIGVGYLDNEKDARAYLQEFGVRFETGHDNGNIISGLYHIKGVPETFIIDKKGDIVDLIISTVSATTLRPELDRLLAGG